MKPIAALLSSVMLTAALLAPAVASETKAPAKPDLAKGEAQVTSLCGTCHTADGKRGAAANPILQGQHPEYLAKQLHDFKKGDRKSAVMNGFAATLTDAQILDVTAFYASKKPVTGAANNKKTVALGEKIYRGGIADRSIPACAACHGPTGSGIPSQYPRLGGQHASYTEAQLLGFRDGKRKNNAQMTGVTAKMNDAEIKAVADYIAGLH